MITSLKIARIKKDFTQGYLARKLGISQSHYSNIERGIKPMPPHVIERIKRELGIDASQGVR
jgi:transcriptional regulator with XRE-family HTH domain